LLRTSALALALAGPDPDAAPDVSQFPTVFGLGSVVATRRTVCLVLPPSGVVRLVISWCAQLKALAGGYRGDLVVRSVESSCRWISDSFLSRRIKKLLLFLF
jgi:hypothetical protein